MFFLFSTYSVKAYELLGCSWDNASDLITFFIDNNDDDIETALGLWNYADCPNVSFKAGGFPFSHNVG
ncbi:hypothetical protein JW865_07190, partial [Candidatus Bathyarchaeota archaeon]|nr:hypothetical protein [Candidatus Bathyarchaeota archaeon]